MTEGRNHAHFANMEHLEWTQFCYCCFCALFYSAWTLPLEANSIQGSLYERCFEDSSPQKLPPHRHSHPCSRTSVCVGSALFRKTQRKLIAMPTLPSFLLSTHTHPHFLQVMSPKLNKMEVVKNWKAGSARTGTFFFCL